MAFYTLFKTNVLEYKPDSVFGVLASSSLSLLFFSIFLQPHGAWKSQKSLIQHCERSELRLHFEWTKVH